MFMFYHLLVFNLLFKCSDDLYSLCSLLNALVILYPYLFFNDNKRGRCMLIYKDQGGETMIYNDKRGEIFIAYLKWRNTKNKK